MKSKEIYYDYVYSRLVANFPKKPWVNALYDLSRTKTPTIDQLVDYIIPYGISLWESKKESEYDEYQNSIISHSMFYCGKILEFLDSLETSYQERLKSRFSAGCKKPSEMRAVTFEVFVFFALASHGYEIECKDNESKKETYDYLINKDNNAIQIECKSFAYDKGLHITSGDSQKLIETILGLGDKLRINEKPMREISLLTLEITKPLPSLPKEKRIFIDGILNEIQRRSYKSTSGFAFHLDRYSEIQNISETDAFLDFLHLDQHGVSLGLTVSAPDGDQSRHGLQITTHSSNGFWREFEKVCKHASKHQLKKNRPASILVHVYNIEILEIMLKDPRFRQKLNNIFEQDHIISVTIISNIHPNIQEEYPFFYISPIIKEFINEKSSFHPRVQRVFPMTNQAV